MEWVDVDTKKRGQIVHCRLSGPLSNGGSSDGSIYVSIPLDGSEGECITNSYLPPKLAQVGGTVSLKHPDLEIDQDWKVVTRGPVRWINKKGEILWGAK
jgi:hypothetical protein